jgi:hypothetical protein
MFDRLNSRAPAVSHRLYRLSFVSRACGTGAANAFAPEVWPMTLKGGNSSALPPFAADEGAR